MHSLNFSVIISQDFMQREWNNGLSHLQPHVKLTLTDKQHSHETESDFNYTLR